MGLKGRGDGLGMDVVHYYFGYSRKGNVLGEDERNVYDPWL
jgi:hypothetical protein